MEEASLTKHSGLLGGATHCYYNIENK